jgi:hypothetical protein
MSRVTQGTDLNRLSAFAAACLVVFASGADERYPLSLCGSAPDSWAIPTALIVVPFPCLLLPLRFIT